MFIYKKIIRISLLINTLIYHSKIIYKCHCLKLKKKYIIETQIVTLLLERMRIWT